MARSGQSNRANTNAKNDLSPMIDRHSRDKLALALRRYAAKRITNDELEDAVGRRSEDRGVTAVQDVAWQLYDDMCCHRADGQHALARDTRRSVARWVLFLRTDHEYSWTDYDFRQSESSVNRFLTDLFTAGRSSRKKRKDWEDFLGAGNFEVWPFLNICDEEASRKRRK